MWNRSIPSEAKKAIEALQAADDAFLAQPDENSLRDCSECGKARFIPEFDYLCRGCRVHLSGE